MCRPQREGPSGLVVMAGVALVAIMVSGGVNSGRLGGIASALPAIKLPELERPGEKPPARGQPAPSGRARDDIPARYLAIYRSSHTARQCPGLSWSVLAGIGKIETNHGRSQLPGVRSGQNFAGAAGPMQFGNGTGKAGNAWARFGRGGNVYNPDDAIPAAARYLCSHGAPGDVRRAVFGYNHSNEYVGNVLGWASRYRAAS